MPDHDDHPGGHTTESRSWSFSSLWRRLPPSPFREIALRLADLTSRVADLESVARLEGQRGERVVFDKSELTVQHSEGVLLNLVSTDGHVGIRFYKGFGFQNEQCDNPWHMGFIEGVDDYEGLAILRDWLFTAALWQGDGKLLLGRLDSHPPANAPAEARVHIRGTIDEVQTIVEGSANQGSDIFQILDDAGGTHLVVNGSGQVVVGSRSDPKGLVLHDTEDGQAYSVTLTNGQPSITPV